MRQSNIKGDRGWSALWRTEDWWAVWLALLLIFAALISFNLGGTLKPIAVQPGKWDQLWTITTHFFQNAHWYIAQFSMWLAIFVVSNHFLGFRLKQYIPSFIFLYVLSTVIFTVSSWSPAKALNLEAPLMALIVGLFIGNFVKLPKWMYSGFRVEYYIKTGIVLLGATLPFTLIMYAGPVALLQATIVSITTFLAIYLFAVKIFRIDKRFAACLGAGGAVCGVSAAIAMSGAVKAKKEHASITITIVIVWAMVMIFILPFAARALNLHPGIAGAWIGTSEFADAAGLAAASQYGAVYETVYGFGRDEALWTYSLMKVIGRDMWIGVWAFIMALVAILRWERSEKSEKPKAVEIWWRFPKFVIGFLVASAIITVVTSGVSLVEFNEVVKPMLITPIKTFRSWAFIFTFLSIGLTTKFKELTAAGWKPFGAFTFGVIINIILGFILSVIILGSYWSSIQA